MVVIQTQGEYKMRVDELQEKAKTTTYDARNPVFRVLQILGHLRDWDRGWGKRPCCGDSYRLLAGLAWKQIKSPSISCER